jgi:hypothetical protein
MTTLDFSESRPIEHRVNLSAIARDASLAKAIASFFTSKKQVCFRDER